MSFGTSSSSFSKVRTFKPFNERKAKKRLGPGRKTEFWSFVNAVLEAFFVKIEQPRTCEIQSEYCDNYHIAKAHTRRRTTISVRDWWFAFRVCFACQECHNFADWREREESEAIIEAVIVERFNRLGLSEGKVRQLLGECAAEVQQANSPKFDEFVVIL